MVNFNVRADYFACTFKFKSNEAARYYLNGVFIDPATTAALGRPGVFLVATDGHRMGIFYDETGTADGPAIVNPDPDLLRRATPSKAGRYNADPLNRLIYADGRAVLQRNAAPNADSPPREAPIAVNLSLIDGTFPDWFRVLPTPFDATNAAPVAVYNGDYVASFADIGRRLGGGPIVSIAGERGRSPALVKLHNVPDFAGVLMPLENGTAPDWPHWLTRAAPAKNAPARERETA